MTVHYPFHRTSLVLCPLALPPAQNYLAFCGALATLGTRKDAAFHLTRCASVNSPFHVFAKIPA